LLALYPAEDYDTNLARYQAMRTDVRFTCPRRRDRLTALPR
jgi:hypothetical protein